MIEETTDKVRTFVREQHMIKRGDRIVIGISGGADSVALFLMLCDLREEMELSLVAVHVNHGIRREAGEDAAYVRDLCEKARVPFHLYCEDIPALAAASGISEEEMGRRRRYARFAETARAEGADKIAVAHHMDDQAETVLFHLARGTGLVGARGMLPVSEREELAVIRPLLCCRKEELTAYLKERNAAWHEDATNAQNRYARNRIRNVVVPELQAVHAGAVPHIARFAQEVSEWERYLQGEVARYLRDRVTVDAAGRLIYDRQDLLRADPFFARCVLYAGICRMCGGKRDVTDSHVRQVQDLLRLGSGRRISLPRGIQAMVSYENLLIGESFTEKDMRKEERIALDPGEGRDLEATLWNGRTVKARWLRFSDLSETEKKNVLQAAGDSKNCYTKFFDCDTIEGTLSIRTPMQGDWLTVDDCGHRKRLSRHFIDRKVPRQERAVQPVLALDDEVLWVLGGRRSESRRIDSDTTLILMLRYEGESNELSY